MKNLFVIAIILLTTFYLTNAQTQDLRVMTFNIRYDNPNDGENAWSVRKDLLINQVKFYKPDIMGIQEGLSHQVFYIKRYVDYLDYVGVGRDDGKEKGEYSAIFYNTNRFEVIESSTFWLSDSPGKVSIGWDASMERICTYALFEDRDSNEKFWVFNTHFDHLGKESRENSAKLILSKIESLNEQDYPVILMGDFNAEPGTQPIQTILEKLNDSKSVSKMPTVGPDGTFNDFNIFQKVERRIDYVFVSRNVSIKKYAVLNSLRDEKYTSDHLAVFVEIDNLNKKQTK